MISVLTHSKAVLPAFSSMAFAGLGANLPLLAFWLLENQSWLAASLLSGYVLSLIVYGFLYMSLAHGFSFTKKLFVKDAPNKSKLPPLGLLMVSKFIVVGLSVVFLLRVVHVASVWMLVGFLITQIGVTASVMRHLKNTKVTD